MSMKCISLLCTMLGLVLLVSTEFVRSSNQYGSLSINLSSKKNQTGHKVVQVVMDKLTPEPADNWKISLQHKVGEYQGNQIVHVEGTLAMPPQRPEDYELFPGVGYYKFHTDFAPGFEAASAACASEGGHLAIVNSEAEHQALSSIFEKNYEKVNVDWAFIGFHDRDIEGHYVTIFGEPLSSTGFTRWSEPNQPDNYQGNEDCGSVHRNGGLNDIGCGTQNPFICEYDLSWSED